MNIVHWNPKNNHRIAELDPLAINTRIRNLPFLNQTGDKTAIMNLLRMMLEKLEGIEQDFFTAAACMRDLGICMGSLKRHKLEPTQLLPQLSENLQKLSEIIQMPPRDNILHYSIWNPMGKKTRMYTSLKEERQLIDCVRVYGESVYPTAELLMDLLKTPEDSGEFLELCKQSLLRLEPMVATSFQIRRIVSSSQFEAKILPYFDPILVDGVEYRGPAIFDIPLFVLEHIIWSSQCQDKSLAVLKESRLSYQAPYLINYYRVATEQECLLSRIEKKMNDPTEKSPRFYRSLELIKEIFDVLIEVRSLHVLFSEIIPGENVPALSLTGDNSSNAQNILTNTLTARERLLKIFPADKSA